MTSKTLGPRFNTSRVVHSEGFRVTLFQLVLISEWVGEYCIYLTMGEDIH